ncbi:MAG: tetratricopeptide repeat protein [bacterium]|jgi:tetratricopeptide (TPR) repeat protein
MAKKKATEVRGDQRLENIEETLSKTEQFIVDNQRAISIVVAVIVVVILAFFGYQRYYIKPKTTEAQVQIYQAQRYFELDSLDKALYGDGNNLGFMDLAEEYSMTEPGNLANYYAGIIHLKKGDYRQAIDYLEDFDGDDHMVGPMATGAIGDAYLELGDLSKGAAYYLEAANQDNNNLTTPLFLFKAGQTYELLENYDDAIRAYERIRDDYPKSNEAISIEKYISRATAAKNS